MSAGFKLIMLLPAELASSSFGTACCVSNPTRAEMQTRIKVSTFKKSLNCNIIDYLYKNSEYVKKQQKIVVLGW